MVKWESSGPRSVRPPIATTDGGQPTFLHTIISLASSVAVSVPKCFKALILLSVARVSIATLVTLVDISAEHSSLVPRI